MVSVPMNYFNQGEYLQAMNWVMTDYIGFGILWMFLGIVLFAVVFSKTQSYGISGVILIVYSAIVSATLPPEIAQYFYLLIAVLGASMLAKLYFGR